MVYRSSYASFEYRYVSCPKEHYEVGWNVGTKVFWEEVKLKYKSKKYYMNRFSTDVASPKGTWMMFGGNALEDIFIGSFPITFGFSGKRLHKLLLLS